jgi:hypothetical protein
MDYAGLPGGTFKRLRLILFALARWEKISGSPVPLLCASKTGQGRKEESLDNNRSKCLTIQLVLHFPSALRIEDDAHGRCAPACAPVADTQVWPYERSYLAHQKVSSHSCMAYGARVVSQQENSVPGLSQMRFDAGRPISHPDTPLLKPLKE